jgi:uncharacterized protein
MINRRQFVQSLALAAAMPTARAATGRSRGFGPLQSDPQRILDLPAGFRYDIVARHGDDMDDGLQVPALADGMAAFAGDRGQVILVCNHENSASRTARGPFGAALERLGGVDPALVYDFGHGKTPGNGGTTTIVWDPAQRRRLRQHLSLAGTEVNCAGGMTPWGSWLSCEECFTEPGTSFENSKVVRRAQRHGYVFEVPARHPGTVQPVPLKAMGRFEHEAAAVDPARGHVYLSEDRHRSLLYRFLPNVPGQLAKGGELQALMIAGQPSFDTRNWNYSRDIEPGQSLPARWVSLDDVDSDDNDLRLRGFERGAARFARGEGLCIVDGEVFLTCTIGGSERLGQIFSYRPLPESAQSPEHEGTLRLVAESSQDSLLRHADNLTISPWGDLVVCEDTAAHCGLVGMRADGSQYPLADNPYSNSELAGICFSPDGRQMFVNVQLQGLTLAISGPWTTA